MMHAHMSDNLVNEKTERQDIAGNDAYTFRRYQKSKDLAVLGCCEDWPYS